MQTLSLYKVIVCRYTSLTLKKSSYIYKYLVIYVYIFICIFLRWHCCVYIFLSFTSCNNNIQHCIWNKASLLFLLHVFYYWKKHSKLQSETKFKPSKYPTFSNSVYKWRGDCNTHYDQKMVVEDNNYIVSFFILSFSPSWRSSNKCIGQCIKYALL